jgi:hypothetical protein
MTRRRVIQHEEESEPVKKKFSRTRFWDNQQNAEKISCGKVSKIFFLLLYDRYIVFFVADNSIIRGRERKKKKLDIHAYKQWAHF